MAPSGPKLRSITGLDHIPTCVGSSLQPWLSAAISPGPRADVFHNCVPLLASHAYTVSFSVARYSTLCVCAPIVTPERYSGWASNAPSVGAMANLENFVALTFAGVRLV